MKDLFAMIFEFFGTVQSTAYEALYEHVYVPAGFLLLGITLIWTILFYQGFFAWKKKARFDTRRDWFMWMVISSLMTTIILWIVADAKLVAAEKEYSVADYAEYICFSFFWGCIFYFIFSNLVKYSNASRRKLPF
jgi:hypothetical protein